MEFRKVKLKDICIEMHQGINTVADKVEYKNFGIPIIQSKNITAGFLDLDDVRYLDKKAYEKYKEKYNPQQGDILLCNIGTIGSSYVICKNEKFLIAWNLFKLKVNRDKYNSQYIKYYLDKLKSEKYFDSLLTGGTVKFINKTKMGEIRIPICELEEQKIIVNVLDKSQELINKRKAQIEALDELVKSQFTEKFGDPINNKNNWDITCVDEITDLVTYGLTVRPAYVEDGVRVISAAEIRSGTVNYDVAKQIATEDYEKLTDKSKPQKNELLFGKAGASIGYCAIIDKYISFAITQNIARIKIRENIVNPYWLMYYLKSDFIQQLCQREAKGNAIKDLQIQSIKAIPVLDCPLEVQNEFAAFVKQVDKLKFEMQNSLKELEDNFNSLMQKSFNGELFK